MKKCRRTVFLSFLMALSLWAANIRIETDRASGLYQLGEMVTFTIHPTDEEGHPLSQGELKAILSKDGGKKLAEKIFDLSKDPAPVISGTLNSPGFLRVTVPGYKDPKNNTNCAGAAFEPEKIEPGAAPPPDFATFWEQEIAAAESIPLDARMDFLAEFSTQVYACYAVSFAAPGGRVYGFLTLPNSGQPVPALVHVPGAGAGFSEPVRNQFSNRVAVLVMNVHSYDPRSSSKTLAELYAEVNQAGWYCKQNSHDRTAYFFHRAILGINRAVNHLAGLPEIDSKRMGAFGSSQGGMFALIRAAINPHIRAATANVPAMCDQHAFLQDRDPGWPRLVDVKQPDTSKTAGYYDVVNFCRQIQVPVRIIVGFADTTSSPATVYAAFNAIPAKNKEIFNEVGMGHTARNSYSIANTWLNTFLGEIQ